MQCLPVVWEPRPPLSMVSSRDPGLLEHHSYSKYTLAIKHCTWLVESLRNHCNIKKMWQRKEDSVGKGLVPYTGARQEIVSSVYFIWAERWGLGENKWMCWNRMCCSSKAQSSMWQGHGIHSQTLNLQRKHAPVNIRLELDELQQSQKRLTERTLKRKRKIKVTKGFVILCWSWLASPENKEVRGAVCCKRVCHNLTSVYIYKPSWFFGVTAKWG